MTFQNDLAMIASLMTAEDHTRLSRVALEIQVAKESAATAPDEMDELVERYRRMREDAILRRSPGHAAASAPRADPPSATGTDPR